MVSWGTERLRITPTLYDDDAPIDALAEALLDVGAARIAISISRARGRVTAIARGAPPLFHRLPQRAEPRLTVKRDPW
jgi:hypothetical protein